MPDIYIGKEEDTPKIETKQIQKEKVKETPKKEHGHLHVFTSYCENPPNVTFADKLDDEELLLFLRKHFVTNVPWIIKAILLGSIPLILNVLSSAGTINIDILPPNYIMLIVFFYYLLVFTYIFANYITWFYNISLVTTQRIIDIDFSSIVFENVAATKLSQVEDVSYSQVGVIRSVFDYGDVLVQTAAAKDEFEFLAVPHPERVIKIINNLIGETKNA